MARVDKLPSLCFTEGAEKARYHNARDAVTTSIVPTSAAIIVIIPPTDHCAARNLQQDNVRPHYANDPLLNVEFTGPPGLSPVQAATELGSSASSVCGDTSLISS